MTRVLASDALEALDLAVMRVIVRGGEPRVLRGGLRAIALVEEHRPAIEFDLKVLDGADPLALQLEAEMVCSRCDGFAERDGRACGACKGVGQVTLVEDLRWERR